MIGYSGFSETKTLDFQAPCSLWVVSISHNFVESAHLEAGLSLVQSLKNDGVNSRDILFSTAKAIETISQSSAWVDQVTEFGAVAVRTDEEERKIVFVGDGFSISGASHSATDFTKSGLRSVAISDANLITAMMNDFGRDSWLVKGLERYSEPGDLLVLLLHDDITAAESDALQWCQHNDRTPFVMGGRAIPPSSTDRQVPQISWGSDHPSSNLVIPGITNLAVADGLLTLGLR